MKDGLYRSKLIELVFWYSVTGLKVDWRFKLSFMDMNEARTNLPRHAPRAGLPLAPCRACLKRPGNKEPARDVNRARTAAFEMLAFHELPISVCYRPCSSWVKIRNENDLMAACSPTRDHQSGKTKILFYHLKHTTDLLDSGTLAATCALIDT